MALVQSFSFAIPRVANEFYFLSHRREPIRDFAYLWVYITALGIFLIGALIQKWLQSRGQPPVQEDAAFAR